MLEETLLLLNRLNLEPIVQQRIHFLIARVEQVHIVLVLHLHCIQSILLISVKIAINTVNIHIYGRERRGTLHLITLIAMLVSYAELVPPGLLHLVYCVDHD